MSPPTSSTSNRRSNADAIVLSRRPSSCSFPQRYLILQVRPWSSISCCSASVEKGWSSVRVLPCIILTLTITNSLRQIVTNENPVGTSINRYLEKKSSGFVSILLLSLFSSVQFWMWFCYFELDFCLNNILSLISPFAPLILVCYFRSRKQWCVVV